MNKSRILILSVIGIIIISLGIYTWNHQSKKSGEDLTKYDYVVSFYSIHQNGKMKRNAWLGTSYVGATGAKVIEDWVYDSQYDAWFYIKADGQHAEKEWLQIKGKDYYFKSGGYLLTSQWIEQAYVSASGAKVQQGWLFDKQYQSWFYIKENGNHADKEWIFENGHYYYLKSGGYMAANEWILDKESWFYLKSDGKMAEKEWVYDSKNKAWYYFKSGGYMAKNETIDGHQLGSDGKWLGEKATNENAAYYQVVPVTANVYNADGEKLSYISQGSVVWLDKDRKSDDKRLAITISGLSGYMKTEDLQALDASKDFIPYYESDGYRFYHYVAQNASIPVSAHLSDMEVGKKYYSADGLHFEGFNLENPFLFKDLTEATNYSAEDLDKVFSLLNINNSLLENKGTTFKEAEEHYHINALYLLAHSALESDWGRSKIAKDKNNFFGITAYDTTPYLSAKTFDDVDKGILGASKWIKENYIDRGRTFLGNKASGMNVEYASDPYWGEKIASVMMKINEKLGGKD